MSDGQGSNGCTDAVATPSDRHFFGALGGAPGWGRGDWLAAVMIGAAAAFLMLWRLDQPYLWQDEAATAVLGERMMRTGVPRAYDGVNLINSDLEAEGGPDVLASRAVRAQDVIDYCVARGDFRSDLVWTFYPWGSLAAAGASLSMLGHGTWQARFPFALAGIASAVIFYGLLRRQRMARGTAIIAATLLLTNVFWLLHMRQCRYYAFTTLFTLLCVGAYLRWREGRRWGAALFALTVFLFFHFDYGTVWPIVGTLGAHALITQSRRWRELAITTVILAVALAPFVIYFRLPERHREATLSPVRSLGGSLFNVNAYVIPIVGLVAVASLLWAMRRRIAEPLATLLWLGAGLVIAMIIWVPIATVYPYHRYLVNTAPMGAMLIAWGAAAIGAALLPRSRAAASAVAILLAALVAATPLLSQILLLPFPSRLSEGETLGPLLRRDWAVAWMHATAATPDPNRGAVELVRRFAHADEPIVTNYEDYPLIFYTPNPIRGGTASLCVLNQDPPPRLMIIRGSFINSSARELYSRAVDQLPGTWTLLDVQAVDVMWGNNPEPSWQYKLLGGASQARQLVFRRSDQSERAPVPVTPDTDSDRSR